MNFTQQIMILHAWTVGPKEVLYLKGQSNL